MIGTKASKSGGSDRLAELMTFSNVARNSLVTFEWGKYDTFEGVIYDTESDLNQCFRALIFVITATADKRQTRTRPLSLGIRGGFLLSLRGCHLRAITT